MLPVRKRAERVCTSRGFLGIGGHGGFAEEVVPPAANVHPLPPPCNEETGALVETLATAWHAARVADLSPESSVIVIGGGPIGVAIAFAVRVYGVQAAVIELSETRRGIPALLGGRALSPEEAERERAGQLVDVVFEAAGGRNTDSQGLATLSPAGRLLVVAHAGRRVELDLDTVYTRGQSIW